MLISIPKRIKNPRPGSDTTYQFTGQATDCFTQTVNDTFKSLKDFVFESHRAKLLPNLFYGIHFGGIGRKSLDMEVITEGVETGQQLATLTDMDCSHFQGYYFSKPAPVEEFETKC